MKKLLSFLLVIVMCFSMTSCGMGLEELVALRELFELDQNIWDTESNNGSDDFKVPIILLHGRVSNTGVFFGVHTAIDVGAISHYGTDFEAMYANPDNHEILSVEEGKLGDYLIK